MSLSHPAVFEQQPSDMGNEVRFFKTVKLWFLTFFLPRFR